MSKVFIVLNVRDDTESKYPSIVFLSIFQGKIKHYELRYCMENSVDPDQLASSSSY